MDSSLGASPSHDDAAVLPDEPWPPAEIECHPAGPRADGGRRRGEVPQRDRLPAAGLDRDAGRRGGERDDRPLARRAHRQEHQAAEHGERERHGAGHRPITVNVSVEV